MIYDLYYNSLLWNQAYAYEFFFSSNHKISNKKKIERGAHSKNQILPSAVNYIVWAFCKLYFFLAKKKQKLLFSFRNDTFMSVALLYLI